VTVLAALDSEARDAFLAQRSLPAGFAQAADVIGAVAVAARRTRAAPAAGRVHAPLREENTGEHDRGEP